MSVIAHFCLNWRMAKLSPETATFPDLFWAPQTKPNQSWDAAQRKVDCGLKMLIEPI